MTGRTLSLLFLCLCGCGRYGDFTLPAVSGGDSSLSLLLDQRPDPVLQRGSFHDVLNPSVLKVRGSYLNLYSGFDGSTWHTLLATSSDGLVWKTRGVVLSPDPHTWEGSYIAANGSALFYAGQFWYWYQAGPEKRRGLGWRDRATRRNGGKSRRRCSIPVLTEAGTNAAWPIPT